jgi:hypothetical protein
MSEVEIVAGVAAGKVLLYFPRGVKVLGMTSRQAKTLAQKLWRLGEELETSEREVRDGRTEENERRLARLEGEGGNGGGAPRHAG